MINLHEEPQVDILWGRLFSYVLLNVLPFDVYPLKNRQIATNRIQLHKHFPKNSITNKMTEIEADNFHQKINCSRYSPYWGTKRPYEGTVLWEISPPASLSMWHFSLVSLKQIDIQVTVQVTQSPRVLRLFGADRGAWELWARDWVTRPAGCQRHLPACKGRSTSLKMNLYHF